jgi:hypothetical protein
MAVCLQRGDHLAREFGAAHGERAGSAWLSGLEQINYHTLSSFRVNRKAELDALFVELLHALDQVELISLERVMHDAPKSGRGREWTRSGANQR